MISKTPIDEQSSRDSAALMAACGDFEDLTDVRLLKPVSHDALAGHAQSGDVLASVRHSSADAPHVALRDLAGATSGGALFAY